MFQEDEGRHHVIATFANRSQAEVYRDNYVAQSKGYLSRSNFSIMEQTD
jgi:hypothetical protein